MIRLADESLEAAVARIDERTEALLNHATDLEGRMRAVERWQAGLAGLGGVVGFLIALDLILRLLGEG